MARRCDPQEYTGILEVVLREDLESLSRTFTREERIELWNEVRSAWRRYLMECSPYMPSDEDRFIRGKFRFAQLMLAATFRLNGEDLEEITGMFRDEEYEILRDFEEYKIFDSLSIDEIVEFIRRREGKVYELVKRYYEKQYNMLDRSWTNIIGNLAYVFSVRYRGRRRKIEEAVIEYVRRYGLLTAVSEIEEAVKKVLEAGELRRRIEEEIRKRIEEEVGLPLLEERLRLLEEERSRLLSRLRELEEKYISEAAGRAELLSELERLRAEKKRLEESRRELEERLRRIEAELGKAIERLRSKEEELERLSREYSAKTEAYELLRSEAESLRASVERLSKQVDEYRSLLEMLRAEKHKVEARLSEVEAALRGESEGHLVTAEDARGFEELLVNRLLLKLGRGAALYDPVRGRRRRIESWDEVVRYELAGAEEGGSLPRGRGVVLVKRRGVLRRRKDVVVEAVTLVHLEAYRERGWDSRPVNLAELLEIVSRRVDEAEKGSYYHILVVASPTGFTRRAVEYIGGSEFHRNFVARYVTVYLLDPVTGTVVRNPADRAAEENEDIARLELPEERVRKVMDYVLSEEALGKALRESPAAPFIRLDQVVEATGERPEVVRYALNRLEEQGYGKVRRSPSGVLAFFYSSTRVG